MDDDTKLTDTERPRIDLHSDSKSNRRISSRVIRACRLPPRGLEKLNSMPATQNDYSIRLLIRTYARELVIAVLAFSLLTMVIIAPAVGYDPQVSIIEERPLAGSSGWDTWNQSCQSSASAYLINNTNLNYRNGWWNHTHYLGYNPGTPEALMVSDGFQVTVAESSVEYRRLLFLPILDYESLDAFIQVEPVSGSANVSLGIGRNSWAENDAESEVEVCAGQTENLSVSLSLDYIKAMYPDDWFGRVYFEVAIFAEDQAVVLLRRLVIKADSSEKLSPVSVNLQTTSGYSLFTDSRLLPYSWYLLLNVTRPADGRQDTIFAQVVNETLYLPHGSYTFKASWSSSSAWWAAIDPVEVDLAVRENATTALAMRLPTIRLDIEQSKDFVQGDLWILLTEDYEDVYSTSLRRDSPPTVYLPASDYSIIVKVYHQTAWGFFGWAQLSYESDGLSDLLLKVDYPGVVFLGIVLTGVDIAIALLLTALVLAILVRLRQVLFGGKTRPLLRDPGLAAVVMVIVGAFLPWFTYDYSIGPTEYTGLILPPFSIFMQQTTAGLAVPYMIGDYWWVLLVPLFFTLFWLPALGTLNQVGTEMPPLDWRRTICLACPAAMALASWLGALWYGSVPDVGFWLVALSPAVFFVQVRFRKALDEA